MKKGSTGETNPNGFQARRIAQSKKRKNERNTPTGGNNPQKYVYTICIYVYSVLIFVAPLEFFTGRDNKYFLLRLPEAWRNLPVASNDNKYIYCVCERRVKLAMLPSTNPPYKRQLLAHGTSDDAKHQNDAHRTLLDCLRNDSVLKECASPLPIA